MKGTRAHFFDYWAPRKKYSRARRGALFPGVTTCQASKWQVKRQEMMMMMTMMQRGTSGFVLFFCVFVFVFFSSRASTTTAACESDPQTVWSPTAAHRRASTALVIAQWSEWNALLLMGNTIESSEVTENSLLNKKTTESNPEYYGNIALLFFFVSLYIYYKGRRHFHAIILSNYSKIKKHKSIFKKQTSVSGACLEIYI